MIKVMVLYTFSSASFTVFDYFVPTFIFHTDDYEADRETGLMGKICIIHFPCLLLFEEKQGPRNDKNIFFHTFNGKVLHLYPIDDGS